MIRRSTCLEPESKYFLNANFLHDPTKAKKGHYNVDEKGEKCYGFSKVIGNQHMGKPQMTCTFDITFLKRLYGFIIKNKLFWEGYTTCRKYEIILEVSGSILHYFEQYIYISGQTLSKEIEYYEGIFIYLLTYYIILQSWEENYFKAQFSFKLRTNPVLFLETDDRIIYRFSDWLLDKEETLQEIKKYIEFIKRCCESKKKVLYIKNHPILPDRYFDQEFDISDQTEKAKIMELLDGKFEILYYCNPSGKEEENKLGKIGLSKVSEKDELVFDAYSVEVFDWPPEDDRRISIECRSFHNMIYLFYKKLYYEENYEEIQKIYEKHYEEISEKIYKKRYEELYKKLLAQKFMEDIEFEELVEEDPKDIEKELEIKVKEQLKIEVKELEIKVKKELEIKVKEEIKIKIKKEQLKIKLDEENDKVIKDFIKNKSIAYHCGHLYSLIKLLFKYIFSEVFKGEKKFVFGIEFETSLLIYGMDYKDRKPIWERNHRSGPRVTVTTEIVQTVKKHLPYKDGKYYDCYGDYAADTVDDPSNALRCIYALEGQIGIFTVDLSRPDYDLTIVKECIDQLCVFITRQETDPETFVEKMFKCPYPETVERTKKRRKISSRPEDLFRSTIRETPLHETSPHFNSKKKSKKTSKKTPKKTSKTSKKTPKNTHKKTPEKSKKTPKNTHKKTPEKSKKKSKNIPKKTSKTSKKTSKKTPKKINYI